MPDIPSKISELIETFDRNIEAYHSQQYNETQLRIEFIDPFFEELGWDVTNKAGNAPQYRDVIHEDAISIAGATKAPDYCFRIGGVRKFFLETKKPSINIKGDREPAYQLRRYAWSAKLPLSILTDFEEFAIYDCLTRPSHTDSAATARIMLLSYKDYPDKWHEIAAIFSKDAIWKGSFDKFAVSEKGKRGTTTVDKEFLAEIESWRRILAQIIAIRNRSLSIPEINFAVQQTIDRILFLRMCEDRGIEPLGQLQAITPGDRVYPRLCEIFEKADQKYNSGLFHFEDEPNREPPDKLTLNLVVDDDKLKWILGSLYYPRSPYEFSVMPPEILGNVYEQFLGKVITLTPAHHAKIEEKPEVKKAGGVYYTPSYIVDYIVKNTVGKLLEGSSCHSERLVRRSFSEGGSEESHSSIANLKSKIENYNPLTPKQVAHLRILDPACGSGSFLLGAYTSLLNYHLDWYINNDPKTWLKKKNPPIYQVPSSQCLAPQFIAGSPISNYRLTITEKKRILLNNIFGVDIDPQAVEVTKLSLLLKVLEGENSQTLESQYRLFHERALPDLANNIKCGNSLIGPDFFENLDVIPPPQSFSRRRHGDERNLDHLRQKINPFDWQKEFPQVFSRKNLEAQRRSAVGGPKADGFDAVIGNPPYVRQETIGEFKQYFQRHYKVYHGVADLYSYFIERGVSLLKEGGYFAYIVSNKWLRTNYAEPLRRWLKNHCIEQIIDFGDLPVFQSATTYPCILVISKNAPSKYFTVTQVKSLDFQDLSEYIGKNNYPVTQATLSDTGWSLTDESTQRLLQKLTERGVPLEKYVDGKIYRGILTGLNEAFVINPETRDLLIKKDPKSSEIIKPFLLGRDIKRYQSPKSTCYLIFSRRGIDITQYPAIKEHLALFKQGLMPKPKDWKGSEWKGRKPGSYLWFEIQDTIDYHAEFNKPKIIYPNICKRPEFTFDDKGIFTNQKCFIIHVNDKYLLGILNSSLTYFLFRETLPKLRGDFYEPSYIYFSKFPIYKINSSNPDEKTKHDKMVKLVEQMLDLHKKLSAAKIPDEKTRIQRQITTTDSQIDKLVYKLYNLTDEEIKIVEGASN
jgi:hypothetical protein